MTPPPPTPIVVPLEASKAALRFGNAKGPCRKWKKPTLGAYLVGLRAPQVSDTLKDTTVSKVAMVASYYREAALGHKGKIVKEVQVQNLCPETICTLKIGCKKQGKSLCCDLKQDLGGDHCCDLK